MPKSLSTIVRLEIVGLLRELSDTAMPLFLITKFLSTLSGPSPV